MKEIPKIPEPPESIAAVVAKVVETRGQSDQPVRGTKHFRGKARVFVVDAHWGTCDAVTVIGHHRKSGQFAKLVMSVQQLEEFSLARIYSPTVIDLLSEHFNDREPYSESYAEELLRVLPGWKR